MTYYYRDTKDPRVALASFHGPGPSDVHLEQVGLPEFHRADFQITQWPNGVISWDTHKPGIPYPWIMVGWATGVLTTLILWSLVK